ncbi:hypothetical protein AAVH_20956 [Aphelenchoides avenae]|nr:hypothetical protein AAVH_20956 [Aphelenchus avenae]
MSFDRFHEAFFFFSRYEAENLRTVCRAFDALASELRDVHGYKLRIDRVSIGTADWSRGPVSYIAGIKAYHPCISLLYEIEGSEKELEEGLKEALSVSHVHRCQIRTSALCESLCGGSAAFFAGVSAEIVELVRGIQTTYYETLPSSTLWNFLLSFDALGDLRFQYIVFLDDDLADDFILRCRAKQMRTLYLAYWAEFRLQETNEDELLQRFRAVRPMLVCARR